MKKFFLLHISKNENFTVHFNELNEVMDQLHLEDVKVDDEVQALLLLG